MTGLPGNDGPGAVRPVAEVLAGVEEPWGLLTDAERVRGGALRMPEDRTAFVAAHLLVRREAARFLGEPEAWREVEIVQRCEACSGPHGVPRAVGHTGVHLSLAHTRGWVAAVAAGVPCGIDVERRTAPAARALTPAETAWLEEQPDRSEAFTRLWVRKEAVVKAGGATLDDLGSLDVREDAAGGCRIEDVGLASRGVRAAVAWRLAGS